MWGKDYLFPGNHPQPELEKSKIGFLIGASHV